MGTLTLHASKYKVHKFHQRYILRTCLMFMYTRMLYILCGTDFVGLT